MSSQDCSSLDNIGPENVFSHINAFSVEPGFAFRAQYGVLLLCHRVLTFAAGMFRGTRYFSVWFWIGMDVSGLKK